VDKRILVEKEKLKAALIDIPEVVLQADPKVRMWLA
jgi:hypothetical protein